MAGPAASFLANGVAAADFFDMSEKTLTTDLRLSRFAARKVVTARAVFLEPTVGEA